MHENLKMKIKLLISLIVGMCLLCSHIPVYAKSSTTKHITKHKHKKHKTKNKKPKCPQNIMKEFKKYKNHNRLIYIAKKESTFKPKAKNGHCIGLMQVNEKVWYNILKKNNIIKSRKDLRSISGNIRAGAYILKHYNNNYRRYQGKK